MLRLLVNTIFPSARSQSGYSWFVLEVDARSVAEVKAKLVEEGLIAGSRVVTKTRDDGTRVAIERTPYILGKAAVGTISLNTNDYVDAGA